MSRATPGESYERRGRKGRGLFSGPSVPSVVRERRASEACFVFASRGNAFVPEKSPEIAKNAISGDSQKSLKIVRKSDNKCETRESSHSQVMYLLSKCSIYGKSDEKLF